MYDDLKKLPLLTADEEKSASSDTLVLHNIRLVASLAQPWLNRGVDEDDLICEGVVGLQIAANRFDPSLGKRFSTYAGYWINDSLRRAVQKAGVVRHPIYRQQEGGDDLVDPSFIPAGTSGDEGEFDAPDEDAPSADEVIELNEWRAKIVRGMAKLTPRERRIVQKFYGMGDEGPHTGPELAAEEGISNRRVSQIRRRAEEKLRS